MKRGNIYIARLDPVEGSQQGGNRPVIIVSRNILNQNSPVVLGVPCSTYRNHKKVYPTQVLIKTPESVLSQDSIAMGEQIRVLSKKRLSQLIGKLSEITINQLNQALLIALDLDIIR